LGGVIPSDPIVPGNHQLLAPPVDFHLARALADAKRLDGNQLSIARWLWDVARSRHLRAVELAHDLSALFDGVHITDKHSLMNDRTTCTMLADHGLDGFQRVIGLLCKSHSLDRRGRGEYMPRIMQFDD
jgi:hypothetical protein